MRQYIILTTIVIMFLLFIYVQMSLIPREKLKKELTSGNKVGILKSLSQTTTNVKTTYESNPYKVLENKYTLENLDTAKKVTDAKKKVIWRISKVFIDVNGKKVREPPSEPMTPERVAFMVDVAKSIIRKRDVIVSEETGLPIDPFPIDMRDNTAESTTDYLSLKLLTNNEIDTSDTFIKKMHLGFNYYLTTNTANDTVELKKFSKFDKGWGAGFGSELDGEAKSSLTTTFNTLKNEVIKNFKHDKNNSKWTLVKIKPDDATDNTYHIKAKGTTKYLCAEIVKSIAPIATNDDELLIKFSKWLRSEKDNFYKYLGFLYNYTFKQRNANSGIEETVLVKHPDIPGGFQGGFRIKNVYNNKYIQYRTPDGDNRLVYVNSSLTNKYYEESARISRGYHVNSVFNFDLSQISGTNYKEDGILYFGKLGRDTSTNPTFMLVPVNKPPGITGYSDNDIFYALITKMTTMVMESEVSFTRTGATKNIVVLEFNPIIQTSLIKSLPDETTGLFETRNTEISKLFSKFFNVRPEYKFTCCNLINKIYGEGSTETKFSRQICLDTKHAIITNNVEGQRLCIPFMNDYCKVSNNPDPVKANIITNIKDPVCGCYDKTSLVPLLSNLYGFLTDPENAGLLDENDENANIANKEKCFFSTCQQGTDAFMTEAQKGADCPDFCGVIQTNIAEANAQVRLTGNIFEVNCNNNSSGTAAIVSNDCIPVVTFPQGKCNQPCSANQTITRLERIVKKNNTSQLCSVPNNSVTTNINCNTIDPENNKTFCSVFPETPPDDPDDTETPPDDPDDTETPPDDPVNPPTGDKKGKYSDGKDVDAYIDKKDEGLSNGAVAGIVVGSIVGVSVIGVVVYKYYKSRKQE